MSIIKEALDDCIEEQTYHVRSCVNLAKAMYQEALEEGSVPAIHDACLLYVQALKLEEEYLREQLKRENEDG